MGGTHDKPKVIDPNQLVTQSNDAKVEQFVKQAFQKACVNGRLYRDKFNEALSILESLKIRRIRDTPLADRLFTVIDKDKSGFINESEYSEGITLLINDKEKRIIYTFKCYDKDEDQKISRSEFYEFIKESWMTAFRLLGESIEKGPNPNRLNLGKLPSVQQFSNKIFNTLDPQNTGFITYQYFRAWIMKDEHPNVRATLEGQEVDVPLNLFKLELS